MVTADLETYEGNCFLGIDAGSTTTKAALVGEDGSLLYSFYSNNNGSPLKTTIQAIKEIYELLPATAKIVYSCSTGYGEALIKAALMLDEGRLRPSPTIMPLPFLILRWTASWTSADRI